MKNKVKPVPDGYHTVCPYLVVNDASRAIDFYAKAFGAKELFRMPGPGGKIMHAEILIGDSHVMLSDETPATGVRSPQAVNSTTVGIFLYLEDVDAVFKVALASGAKELAPLQDMFWGDRYGKLADPFGHQWMLATHKEDVSPEEMESRMSAAIGKK
jgi:PhnB protein